MSSRNIHVETKKYGQPRPYANHEYLDVLTFTRSDERTTAFLEKNNLPRMIPWYVDRESALKFARTACPYLEPGDKGFNWAAKKLKYFLRLEPTPHGNPTLGPVSDNCSDKWEIFVESDFTD